MSLYDDLKKKKYITALAPMEGVTDSVFRQMVVELGKPDLFFTEFLSVEGFCSVGRESVMHRLKFSKKERPIVIQLWGNVPDYYSKTVRYIRKLKPDGIDINIGCSVRDVLSGGKGSALIKDQKLVKEIIDAVKGESKNIPLSVKTRLGYDSFDEKWIIFLLKQNLDMLTIHGRSSKESYSTPSNWDRIADCVEMKNEISPETLMIGNGDVKTLERIEEYVEKYGVDGVMVGRAILNNPWLFSGRAEIPKEERFNTLIKHLSLFNEVWDGSKPFNSQKKYIKAYINGFDGANEIRKELMKCNSVEEVISVLRSY